MNTSKLRSNLISQRNAIRILTLGWVIILLLMIGGLTPVSAESRFEIIPSSGEAPLNVTFVDQSINDPGRNWTIYSSDNVTLYTDNYSYTDNFSNPLAIPKYRFDYPGQYRITLVTYLDDFMGGHRSSTFSDNITVSPPVISANFTSVYTNGSAPMNVSFVDLSKGNITRWDWSFGDNFTRSSDRNPEFRFEKPGTYPVTLTVRNDLYGVSSNSTRVIHVSDSQYPIVRFSTVPISGCVPLNVTFVDQTMINPEKPDTYWYSYTFGDGNYTNSSESNVEHTYTLPGTYFPSLTLTSKSDGGVTQFNATSPVVASNSTGTGGSYSPIIIDGKAPMNVSVLIHSW